MISLNISLQEMQPFVEAAFLLDTELLKYYDKGEKITRLEDIPGNILKKIEKHYPDAICVGLLLNDTPVGYFVYQFINLISFGLDKNYRNSTYLKEFWEIIKATVGNDFSCVLYDYNTRAIQWLEKCGMEVTLKNVTVLTLNE